MRGAPEHRVVATVRERGECREGTELEVAVGREQPVGCAVPVRGPGGVTPRPEPRTGGG
ncbi:MULTISPECIES: hypothetical protein [unclassified Streptomyces]|uniref:hypothetical protein n=1 Tax=unclassified Streptomyces TaxID=2593676 RepID=UPI00136E3882|nr:MULTISPECIES: hypothetical protein [unclassified Streptomyces]MYR24949.1 hypothetical protein [Streptomyces sp. SID4945]